MDVTINKTIIVFTMSIIDVKNEIRWIWEYMTWFWYKMTKSLVVDENSAVDKIFVVDEN